VPMLARTADAVARRLGSAACYLSNGGNTRWHGATWIHYLHAAYEPDTQQARARMMARAGRRRYLADEARAVTAATAIVCHSRRTAVDETRCYGVARDRLQVVYYGVDGEAFDEITDDARAAARASMDMRGDRPVALFVGALGDRRKGFDLLFDAWMALSRDARWDVDLAVAGTGAEADAWERRAQQHGLGERFRFLGFRTDVPAVMAAADVIVHPSRYEAYGLSVHEAVCRGLPALVAADAGVVERLPDSLRPLTLPAPLTAASLADRLRLWRDDIDGWRARARAAGAELRRRSWDHMAAEIAALVEAC
jgi:glycosyltransferase involved in cell wall biosynthesis